MWTPPGAQVRCPWCATAGVVSTGGLRCGACGRTSPVRRGIWDAMGPHHPERTLAQLANSIPPEPQLYEAVWRRSAARRFSGGVVAMEAELAELTDAIEPEPGQLVVDIGCSEGLYARTLAGRGAAVLAVDHSREFLVQAQRRAGDAGVTLWPIRALAQHLPLADGSVQAAVIGGTLNEIGDVAAALSETRRVLSDAGRVFSTSLIDARGRVGRAVQRAVGVSGISFPTLAETCRSFEDAGLSVTDARCDGILLRIRAVAR